jgi:hypothetical protein
MLAAKLAKTVLLGRPATTMYFQARPNALVSFSCDRRHAIQEYPHA